MLNFCFQNENLASQKTMTRPRSITRAAEGFFEIRYWASNPSIVIVTVSDSLRDEKSVTVVRFNVQKNIVLCYFLSTFATLYHSSFVNRY